MIERNPRPSPEYLDKLERVVGFHLNKAAKDMAYVKGPVTNGEMVVVLERIIDKIRMKDGLQQQQGEN